MRGPLDRKGRNELRFGIHLSMPYMMMFMPSMSGVDLKLIIGGGRLRFQMALKVYAFPPAAVIGIGFII